jgi:hypothetical protein
MARLDRVPSCKPRKHFTREASDAVVMAEVVKHVVPGMVDMHNYYVGTASQQQKLTNWATLHSKVLTKVGCTISMGEIKACVQCVPGVAEVLLSRLWECLDRQTRVAVAPRPSAEQVMRASEVTYDITDDEKRIVKGELRARISGMVRRVEILEARLEKQDRTIAILRAKATDPTFVRLPRLRQGQKHLRNVSGFAK